MKKYYWIALGVIVLGLGVLGTYYTDSLAGNLRSVRTLEEKVLIQEDFPQNLNQEQDVASSEAKEPDKQAFYPDGKAGEIVVVEPSGDGKKATYYDINGKRIKEASCSENVSNEDCADLVM